MKQILFSFFLLASLACLSEKIYAQACPIINSAIFTTPDVTNCTNKVSVNVTNQTNGNKSIFVEVKNGNAIIFTECILLSGDKDLTQTVLTSNSFTFCGNLNQLVITVTSSTSGGFCGGGYCGIKRFGLTVNSILPVKFKTFSAIRNKDKVAIKWITTTEINNRGFNVQRNTNGVWENVAFVFSAAQDGNSADDLSYSFNDPNNVKGVSQYRIQQVDLDNRASYTDVRSVRGEALSPKLLVYPNPSMDGKVSVVFEDGGSLKNVVVSDMSGRMIKQYRNIGTNNLSIDGLENGVYSIQVIDLSSAAMSVEKIIIKKR
jgi:hypothetical protein